MNHIQSRAKTERTRLDKRAEKLTIIAQVRFSQPGKAVRGVRLMEAARRARELSGEIGEDRTLAARLEAARRHHAQMKLVNRFLRNGNDDGLRRLGFTALQIADLKTPDLIGRVGFPNNVLKASNATIARLEARLEAMA